MEIVEKVAHIVRQKMLQDTSGHDFWHVQAVLNNALMIAKCEDDVNITLVSLGALLHDIADHKMGFSDDECRACIHQILNDLGVEDDFIEQTVSIVLSVSFKGGKNVNVVSSLEAKIVQDADRLEAMGAIGIARAFAYGGYHHRTLFDPTCNHNINPNCDTISHFHTKLLLLKDLMHTQAAKNEAQIRHEFMLEFLQHFHAEFEGRI